ncbi:hypothetical protein HCA61_09540 [Rhodococcus sp. HNM0563]|uniref:hypothetical protein n=1 Tax=unclassified Rhodococcus (in: high G+C Gram-positive bacteria) TaxID=192944 RepID=UPI001469B11C|nr:MULTISPECIES: hypothetical protein [unclassified Rhodococcus (in: high G+C Gram-positive bacteria)]MCK0089555.1 hypothetical protein [Rhodococcus sp. F64268]NLU62508.1 hypothetical protein [Rhodococcus sp. HNM0563]
MSDSDVSLWEALGLSPDSALEPVPDDVWDGAVGAAVDPDAAIAPSGLVPDDASVAAGDDIVLDDDDIVLGGTDSGPEDETSDVYSDSGTDLDEPVSGGLDGLDLGW